ncbi:site-specific integrase [Thiomonas delicata]|uniref:Putative Site-specific recombinase, phage integrase family n=1 Tax=Thiomonas delicata TaxID=364030 RepID=A0A238D7T8_THIDL|nr:site-specific integrase [Thiomonas delicata]SBP89281.1 putative Site-specific recombinase, phage integrase family [Thiomonas delicata]
MAYIEQRKSGWMAQVRRKGAPTLSRTFDLKIDAEAWAREVERDLQRGNIAAAVNEAGKITFKEVADRLKGARTLDPTQAQRLRVASEIFGAYFLSAIRSVDVATWRDTLLADGLSSQTVVHHLNALSSVFTFAEKELSIPLPSGNPARAIRKPALPKARDRRLRPGELEYLLPAAAESRAVGMRQIIILAIETSMRLGELFSLEWSRIDLSRRIAHLPETKNGESRTVALSSKAVEALRSLPRRLDGHVFGWKSKDSFEKAWQRTKARALSSYETDCGKANQKPDPAFLTNLRFHDLRHEATSCLFEKGLGIMEVASMTGHKTLAMLRRYTHIEAEKLAAKLG